MKSSGNLPKDTPQMEDLELELRFWLWSLCFYLPPKTTLKNV